MKSKIEQLRVELQALFNELDKQNPTITIDWVVRLQKIKKQADECYEN